MHYLRVEKRSKRLTDSTQYSTFTTVGSTTTSDACLPTCPFVFAVVKIRKHRLGTIREYRWDKGTLLSDDAQSLLSKGELQFFQKYDELLSSYMQRTGFDLTAVPFLC